MLVHIGAALDFHTVPDARTQRQIATFDPGFVALGEQLERQFPDYVRP